MTIDLHLDLAMNAMEWNRDLRLPVSVINEAEAGMNDKPGRSRAAVSLPALREGGVGLVVATQIARVVKPGGAIAGWHSPAQAWAETQAQLAWYRAMEEEGEMVMIRTKMGMEDHLRRWAKMETNNPDDAIEKLPIGFVLSLEGADSLIDLRYLERAYAYGLRAVGPAHYGPGRYANGTNATGQMGPEGIGLLAEMDRLHMILDATHLCDDAFWQAMDHFKGPVWASHHNCRSIVHHNRQFSDDQIRELIRRDAVIGAAMDAWMIVPGWEKGKSTPQNTGCTLDRLIDHIDHICQLAGNVRHVAIGTDLDGGYGTEQSPSDIRTITDLVRFPALMEKRGYSPDDIDGIMQGNARRFLDLSLP